MTSNFNEYDVSIYVLLVAIVYIVYTKNQHCAIHNADFLILNFSLQITATFLRK